MMHRFAIFASVLAIAVNPLAARHRGSTSDREKNVCGHGALSVGFKDDASSMESDETSVRNGTDRADRPSNVDTGRRSVDSKKDAKNDDLEAKDDRETTKDRSDSDVTDKNPAAANKNANDESPASTRRVKSKKNRKHSKHARKNRDKDKKTSTREKSKKIAPKSPAKKDDGAASGTEDKKSSEKTSDNATVKVPVEDVIVLADDASGEKKKDAPLGKSEATVDAGKEEKKDADGPADKASDDNEGGKEEADKHAVGKKKLSTGDEASQTNSTADDSNKENRRSIPSRARDNMLIRPKSPGAYDSLKYAKKNGGVDDDSDSKESGVKYIAVRRSAIRGLSRKKSRNENRNVNTNVNKIVGIQNLQSPTIDQERIWKDMPIRRSSNPKRRRTKSSRNDNVNANTNININRNVIGQEYKRQPVMDIQRRQY